MAIDGAQAKKVELEEIVGSGEISELSQRWISESTISEQEKEKNLRFLLSIGADKKKILKTAFLISVKHNTLTSNYRGLKKIGAGDKQIIANLSILGRNNEILFGKSYQILKSHSNSNCNCLYLHDRTGKKS